MREHSRPPSHLYRGHARHTDSMHKLIHRYCQETGKEETACLQPASSSSTAEACEQRMCSSSSMQQWHVAEQTERGNEDAGGSVSGTGTPSAQPPGSPLHHAASI